MMFIGLEGVVVLGPVSVGGTLTLAPYAKPFLFWASTRMRVAWLTQRSPREQLFVAHQLGLRDDAVAMSTGFRKSPVEVFAGVPGAIWVTASATPEEREWARATLGERFVGIDARVGVTPTHKAAIEHLFSGE